MKQIIKTSIGIVSKSKDDLLRVTADHENEVTLADAQQMAAAIATISQGQKLPLLVDIRKGQPMTRNARKFFASKSANTAMGVTATAMLVDSPMTQAIGNFFLKIQKPVVPFRIFTSEESALEWLEQFKTDKNGKRTPPEQDNSDVNLAEYC